MVVAHASPATAAKELGACKVLKTKQMTKVLGQPVSGPGTPTTNACGFDVGPGLGEPGGGLVTVILYRGQLAKSIWAGIEPSTEAIPGTKARYEEEQETAYVNKKKGLVGINLAFTSDDPPSSELRTEAGKLATAASKRV
jgi:hypothetical protein